MQAVARLDRVATTWWFGHVLLLGLCTGVLAVAVLMRPDPDVLTLFGWEVPVVCSFRRLFGVGCPGCGLTRSFVFLAHGMPLEALRINAFGPFLFALVAAQPPWRLWRLWRGPSRDVRGG